MNLSDGAGDFLTTAKLLFVSILVFPGCATTLPVNYQPQNIVRYEGRTDVGAFTYVPAMQGKIASNQLENTAIGTVYIGADVNDLVRRATALELEKTGVALRDDSAVAVKGDVIRFLLDDLGYSIEWTYCIRYVIQRKSDSAELLNSVYVVQKKTGKFGMAADYTPSVNEAVLSGYDQFIRDGRVRAIFSGSPLPVSAAVGTAELPQACVAKPAAPEE